MKNTLLRNAGKIVFWMILIAGVHHTAQAQLSGTYTIGGTGADYATFSAAASDLGSSGVSGPVVFNVRTGTYPENVTINAISGASATNTITFQSETGVAGNVDLQSSANNDVLILNGGDYITFQNITISYTGNGAYSAVELRNKSDYITFDGCILNGSTSTSTGNTNSVVYVSQTSSTTKIDYLTINNCEINGGGTGIYYTSGTLSATRGNGLYITNNTLNDNYARGLWLLNNTDAVVNGNTVNRGSGYASFVSMLLSNLVDNLQIVGNRLNIDEGANGIDLSSSSGTSVNPVQVANNMISISATNNIARNGILITSSSYVNVYFNSIYINYSGSTGVRCLATNGTITAGSINILNNNLSLNSPNTSSYVVYISNTGQIGNWDYNNYHRANSGYTAYFGGNRTTLANLQSASGKDANSISIDPGFVSTTDLHTTEPAMQTGTPIAGITTDIDGDIRQNPPYIGADEIAAPAVGDDAAVTALVSPAIPPCPGSNTFQVEITNYGTNTLSSVTVNWSINGVPQTPVNATGLSVATNSSTTITLGTATLNSNTVYNFIFSTDAPNGNTDANQTNDSLINNGVYTSLGGTYTIGGTSPDFANFLQAVTALNAYGVCGPVVFDVRQGTYTEQIEINTIANVSATNTVTFRADAANTLPATLQYNSQGSGTSNYVLQLNGASYIRFENLTINTTNTGSNSRVIYFSNNNTDIRFEGNTIEAPATTSNSVNKTLVYMENNSGTYDNDIVFDGNQLLNGSNALYAQGTGTSTRETGHQFINNTVEGFAATGLEYRYQSGLVITGNIIRQATSGSATGVGIVFFYVDGDVDILNNTIEITGGSTAYGFNTTGLAGTSGNDVLIANNFITVAGTNTVSAFFLGSLSTYIDIAFNNIYVNGTNASSTRSIYTSGGNNIRLYNNNIQNDGAGYAIYTNTSAITDADYNNYYYNASGNFAYRNATLATFAAWASVSGYDGNSVNVDPQYTLLSSPYDLHISASALAGKGFTFGGITTDIDGDSRTAPPTIGADEITPTGCTTPIANNTATGGGAFCANAPGGTLTGSTPTGGDGVYVYTWEVSTDGVNYITAGSGQNQSYGTLTADTWYRRIVTAGMCADTSAAATFTITPAIANNTATGGGLHCDVIPAGTIEGTLPTGGTGSYTYQWQISTDGSSYSDVTVDGTLKDYDHPSHTANTWYRRQVTSGQCSSTSNAEQLEIKTGFIWTGDVSSNWHVPANWDCGDVPDLSTDVYIPAAATNQPEILPDSIGNCHTIYLEPGTDLRINQDARLNVID